MLKKWCLLTNQISVKSLFNFVENVLMEILTVEHTKFKLELGGSSKKWEALRKFNVIGNSDITWHHNVYNTKQILLIKCFGVVYVVKTMVLKLMSLKLNQE